MSINEKNILSSICYNYIKSEAFKLHLNNITEPFVKTLLNEFGIYLYIFIFYILLLVNIKYKNNILFLFKP